MVTSAGGHNQARETRYATRENVEQRLAEGKPSGCPAAVSDDCQTFSVAPADAQGALGINL